MQAIKLLIKTVILISLIFAIHSCTKPAGPGGKAVIKGKLYAKNFDSYNVTQISQYYIAGENVYISYGSSEAVGNDVKSSVDGTFQFLYLNKGHYKIFANSRDTSIKVKNSKKTIPVVVEVDINSTNQIVDVGDIIINK
jgi:hypothetical protein